MRAGSSETSFGGATDDGVALPDLWCAVGLPHARSASNTVTRNRTHGPGAHVHRSNFPTAVRGSSTRLSLHLAWKTNTDPTFAQKHRVPRGAVWHRRDLTSRRELLFQPPEPSWGDVAAGFVLTMRMREFVLP